MEEWGGVGLKENKSSYTHVSAEVVMYNAEGEGRETHGVGGWMVVGRQ